MRPFILIVLLCFGSVSGMVFAESSQDQIEDGDWGVPVSDPLGKLYDEAMELYKQHRYVEAREKFLQVQSISPDAYPSSKAFLKRIDQHVDHQEKNLKHEQERQDISRKKKEEQLLASKEAQFKELRRTYRHEKISTVQQKRADALKQQKAAKDLIYRGENRYKNILALYKAGRLKEARDQVQLLKNFLIKYDLSGDARIRLTQKVQKAEILINKREKNREEKAVRLERYNQSLAQKKTTKENNRALAEQTKQTRKKDRRLAQEAKLHQDAKVKETKTLSKKEQFAALLAGHKSVEREEIGEQANVVPVSVKAPSRSTRTAGVDRSQREELKTKLTREVDALYHDGVELYRVRQWTLAKNIFMEVDKLWPNYRSTRVYLTVIDQNEQLSAPAKAVKSREEIVGEALDSYQ